VEVQSPMRRILLAVLILALPSAVAINVYYFFAKPIPTKRDAVGLVSTIAGSGQPGVQDGKAGEARFSDPFGIALDKHNNVIVSDGGQGNRIRTITQDGNVKTIAGSDEGFRDGDALQAQFDTPSGIAIDKDGAIVIADTSNNRIRRLSADGRIVSTIAGSGVAGFKDGSALEAQFDGPIGIAVDRKGNIFVADAYNDSIRRISTDGEVTTLAGSGTPGRVDAQGASASFDTPTGVAADKSGNIFVADTGNHAIRKITPAGDVTTVGGGPDGELQENDARLNHPVGIVVTHDGFIFVADEGRGRIIRVTPEGEMSIYAGRRTGFSEGLGADARFNSPCGIARDREGNLYVADSQNYLVRAVFPAASQTESPPAELAYIQPAAQEPAPRQVLPLLEGAVPGAGQAFVWPLRPQDQPHEITGVVGEARGAPGGIALDHIHSGLDVRGNAGEAVLAVYDEKVSSPIANWDFEDASEGIQVGLFSYFHIRVGRNSSNEIQAPERFKPRTDPAARLIGIRVRRGTRFRVGDFLGTVNRLNHVHLNLGPWNAQVNPLQLAFAGLKDTVAPTIEKNGIQVVPVAAIRAGVSGQRTPAPFPQRGDRPVVSGDAAIVVTAFDRVDANGPNRKLGLYKLGYQLLNEDRTPAKGFEQPVINIEFNRLPPDDSAVFTLYAEGSGVSAYGTPTMFKYIATNRVRDGAVMDGLLRSGSLPSGNYIVKVIAEDYAGNRASGITTELPITILN
ncbi:MAG TPA: NHL repeat-containing protein, partial [Blastocatellia bacterium]|nr:NHL repeat-containing protein [Blastocatellia bacterium]